MDLFSISQKIIDLLTNNAKVNLDASNKRNKYKIFRSDNLDQMFLHKWPYTKSNY